MSLQTTEYELGSTKLFEPIKVGDITLKNRIFYPPTTRLRASIDGVPTDLQYEYYTRRSKNFGGLITVEGTFISPGASGMANVPGIYSDAQVKAWRKITDSIHANGSFAAVQLWNLGRVADPVELKRLGQPLVGPSPIYFDEESEKVAIKEGLPLRELTIKEIERFKEEYVQAAKNAIFEAGFDLIELHDAHGYFLDTFLQPSSNQRADKYGGSIENRARLVLEIIDELIPAIGASKIGIRLSPWATFQGMKAENEEVHPVAQMSYLINQLEKRKIAFVSVVEPRVSGIVDTDKKAWVGKSNDWVYLLYSGVVFRAGNYLGDREDNYALLRGDLKKNDNTVFGAARYFTSNPDLAFKLKNGLELTPYARSEFYSVGNYHYDTWRGLGEEVIPEDDKESKRIGVALV